MKLLAAFFSMFIFSHAQDANSTGKPIAITDPVEQRLVKPSFRKWRNPRVPGLIRPPHFVDPIYKVKLPKIGGGMACPDVYKPVCGLLADGSKKTFSNSCYASISGFNIVSTTEGACEGNSPISAI